MKFLCGAARQCVTPPLGTHLYGYTPYIVCDEIHDNLYVSAIAFSNEEKKLLLISVDSGDLNTYIFEELKNVCAAECKIDSKNIIIAATHTHCAPNLSGFEGWGEIDRVYYEKIFRPAVIKVSKDAFENLKEAKAGIAAAKSNIGINRREHTENCDIILGQNPWGQYDPEMSIIKIIEKDTKKGIVNIIHYGCHGTACGASTIVTRDWYGIMLDRLEKETDTLCVFINGAIGDVGPRLTNGKTVGDINHVEELGAKASFDAIFIEKQIKSFHTPTINSFYGEIKLPYKEMPSLEEIKKQKEKIKAPEKLCNCDALKYKHLCDVEDILTGKNTMPKPASLNFSIPIFTVSDICIIPFPFEMFSETVIRIKHFNKYQNTLCLSCANGYNGYLPSQDALCRGGYEVDVFKYGNIFPLADNTDDNLIKETLNIINKEIY